MYTEEIYRILTFEVKSETINNFQKYLFKSQDYITKIAMLLLDFISYFNNKKSMNLLPGGVVNPNDVEKKLNSEFLAEKLSVVLYQSRQVLDVSDLKWISIIMTCNFLTSYGIIA